MKEQLEPKMNQSVESLVKHLKDASKAYYETSTPVMSDADYDMLVEQLQALDPNNPYLNQVGSNPSSNVVKLPIPMPSLDKRKPDTLRESDLTKGPYVLMDKLDGISALWSTGYNGKPVLYLRGNGVEGQDVSHCIGGIQGLHVLGVPHALVRGELIVPKGVVQGSLARNWVNGQLHQTTPSKEELSKIRFVAYQVCAPSSLTRSQQITWLQSRGFEIPWFRIEAKPIVESLSLLFKERRTESMYECDGIVVGQDSIPVLSQSNPKDAYAFKMPLDDQRAQTIVKSVHWASSLDKRWIPRIEFEPVVIGTATISFCSGFHAQYIMEKELGPGALVIIRRSGDVIPILDSVLEVSPSGWQQPPAGQWAWDSNHVHAIDTSIVVSIEKLALELAHGLITFGIEGISKTSTKKLVQGKIQTLQELMKAPVNQLQSLLGKTTGVTLHTSLPKALASATSNQWIYAYLGWPKGFGPTRIAAMLELESNVAKWSTIGLPPKGIGADSFAELLKAVPSYLEWRNSFTIPTSIELCTTPKQTQQVNQQTKGFYVLSGFRDAELQTKLEAAGWKLQERITAQTNVLLIPSSAKETTKVQAARKAGIRIISRNEVDSLLLH
jgi:NAD-dependent DNA ligase